MIASQFLQDVVNYVDDRIAKVVLNGSYEITDFEEQSVTGSTLALNYIVPVAAITTLTLIELKDSSNQVITTNNVNVPIHTDTLFLQTIEVKEAEE